MISTRIKVAPILVDIYPALVEDFAGFCKDTYIAQEDADKTDEEDSCRIIVLNHLRHPACPDSDPSAARQRLDQYEEAESKWQERPWESRDHAVDSWKAPRKLLPQIR